MSPRAQVRLAAMVLAALALSGCRQDSPIPPQVVINGHVWYVDVASTDEQRYRGLSGRASLSDNAGMLFVFQQPCVLHFCMRQCLIPLDIAFIGPDLRVVSTHTMAVEPDGLGRVTYSSQAPAQWALETPAGSLAAAGVRVGDPVTLKGNIVPPAKASPCP